MIRGLHLLEVSTRMLIACSLAEVMSLKTLTEGAHAIAFADCVLRRNVFHLASTR
jgi:hypothetical protein